MLTLVRRDGAERATSKTTTMHTYRGLDHFIGRNMLVLIFGVRHILVGQVVDGIELFGRKRRIAGIDNYILFTDRLHEGRLMDLIRFNLNEAEVLGMLAFIAQGFFVRREPNSIGRAVIPILR